MPLLHSKSSRKELRIPVVAVKPKSPGLSLCSSSMTLKFDSEKLSDKF
jgi:hypothetical protein